MIIFVFCLHVAASLIVINAARLLRKNQRALICDDVMALGEGARISVLSPIIRAKKGEHKAELAKLQKEGFVRVRVDGEMRYLEEDIELNQKPNILSMWSIR